MFDKLIHESIQPVTLRVLRQAGIAASLMTFGFAPYCPAHADDTPVVEQAAEDSVLVATRQAAEEEYEATEGGLEPISSVSEFEPEPADPPSQPSKEVVPPVDEEAAEVEITDLTATAPAEPPIATSPGDVAAAMSQDSQKVCAAPFKGLVAGESSEQDLLSLWGLPTETRKTSGGKIYRYRQDHFANVEVLVESATVQIIKAELHKQAEPKSLSAKLHLDLIDSVEVRDETGKALGVAYPEKCLLLLLSTPDDGVAPAAPQFVTHIVLQAPDAESFALRADSRPMHAYSKRLRDLNKALVIDPEFAHALWLRSSVYLSTGQPVKAEADAKLAMEQEPANPVYRLRWCESLAAVGQYDKSVLETRKVIDEKDTPELVKAQALALMGRLASLGEANIADKAIGFHTTAIALADKLATSPDDKVRRQAKLLLINSHLEVAIEISRRSYDNKNDVVAQWIGRASGFAEEMIANEDGALELRLLVSTKALEALANFKPSRDPAPFVKEAGETATAIIASTDDKLQEHKAHWELGKAYFNALRVAHSRREADRAIEYGEKAIDHLAAGAESADDRPAAEALVGRLYFHIGAAYAVHKQDHKAAVEWYDRAQEMLIPVAPKTELVIPRQLGESLVSMGVSYWDQDQQEKAVQLTLRGAEIMNRAVTAGVLDRSALGVPYGNLSTMYRKQGNTPEAAKYTELAAQSRGAQAVAKRPAASPQAGNRPVNSRTAKRPSGTTNQTQSTAPPSRTGHRTNRGTIVR